jgi:hypothetical protein
MLRFFHFALAVSLWVSCLNLPLHAQDYAFTPQTKPAATIDSSHNAFWSSTHAVHVMGMPDARPKESGTLTITPHRLTFSGKSSTSTIPFPSIVALSAGDERVELWGIKGRLMRMAIPDGGGVALASVMHHKRDMLTVEFIDNQGGYHGSIFYLHSGEAEAALHSVTLQPSAWHETQASTCSSENVRPFSVEVKPLLSSLTPSSSDLPSAYRVLLYERTLDRMHKLPGSEVHRDGVADGPAVCAQYTVRFTTIAFKAGSQVERASLGPVGIFVGVTQITMDIEVTDRRGTLIFRDQVKASQRGESESINVIDSLAKHIARNWGKEQKELQKRAQLNRG